MRDYGIVAVFVALFVVLSSRARVLQPGQPAEHSRPVVGDIDHRGGGHVRAHRRRLRPLGRFDLRLLRRHRRAHRRPHRRLGRNPARRRSRTRLWRRQRDHRYLGPDQPVHRNARDEHHDRRVRARAYRWEPDQRARQRALHCARSERLRDDQVLRLDASRLHAPLRLPPVANDLRPPRLRIGRQSRGRPPLGRARQPRQGVDVCAELGQLQASPA